jgi:hypothetical protein
MVPTSGEVVGLACEKSWQADKIIKNRRTIGKTERVRMQASLPEKFFLVCRICVNFVTDPCLPGWILLPIRILSPPQAAGKGGWGGIGRVIRALLLDLIGC